MHLSSRTVYNSIHPCSSDWLYYYGQYLFLLYQLPVLNQFFVCGAGQRGGRGTGGLRVLALSGRAAYLSGGFTPPPTKVSLM